MASQSESRNPIRHFHRRTSSKDQAIKISAPMLAFTDAENRHDLYALQPKITRSVTTQSLKPTRSKLQKKIHIADLKVGRIPPFPSAAPTSIQNPVASPTTIGVALGSPTYWPSTRPYTGRGSLDSYVPSNNVAAVPAGLQSAGVLNKESRRKLFSSLFGRKSSVSTRQDFYKLQPSEISQTLATVDNQHVTDQRTERIPSTAAAPAIPRWNQGIQRPSDDMRPRLQKSVTMPFEYSSRPPSPPPKDFPRKPPVSIKKPAQDCPNCTVRSPMLKVTIPDIKMERYSVMFKDVLKPRQSLLARRHAQLKGLEIMDSTIPDVPKIIPELRDESSAAAPSSQLLPYKVFFPDRPVSRSGTSQRAGLSRSNTVPNSVRQPMPTIIYPKRTDSHAIRSRSPSHGSETPTSVHSEWHSQESPGASDTSDEDFDDGMCENIIIQLEDLSLPYGLPTQRGPGFIAELQDNSMFQFPSNKQPINETDHLESFHGEPQYSIRDQSHNKAPTITKYNLMPSSAIPRGDNAIIPSDSRAAGQQRQQVMPPSSYSQQTEARLLRHQNPLKSSPASPTEITTARQLSWTRSQQIAIVNAKQAVQPRIITIADNSSSSELKTSNTLTAGHTRNRSEYVVVESI